MKISKPKHRFYGSREQHVLANEFGGPSSLRRMNSIQEIRVTVAE
jgi:hypothetical protein